MANRIQIRRGTAAAAALSNPTLAQGEIGWETDTRKFKVGDGVTPWNSLGYEAREKTFGVAFSDEATAITTGVAKVTFHMPYNMTLMEVFVGLTTAQSSGSILTVDLNKNGVSVLSTKITIDNGEDKSLTAATQPVILTSTLVKGDKMSVDVDQSGVGGYGGKIYLIGV